MLGGQQESGSVGIASRGNDGQITYREWHPVGVEEYGYVAADPLDTNIVYGGKITRFDKRTGQTQNIAPEAVRSGKYRFVRTAPVLFSPIDPKTLFFAGNVLFKTQTGGDSWEVISPDLSRERYDEIPASVGIYTTEEMKKMPRRGVIYAVAPSYVDSLTIWAGTDDGLIHVTRDGGKNWRNVTPPSLKPWAKVSQLDASHTDANVVYAAINGNRLDDMKPHILRTRDGGATWQEITRGLPDQPINTVREDPLRKGLLFAGSETAVSVSFDDGDNWQPLRLNMPATSIRDLVIKDDDLVVGTHGRSFWILDDITPLRQLTAEVAKAPVTLFRPQRTYRVRWNMNPDTPLPQEEPAGQNPPDGAIINYTLQEKATGLVTLDILNASGELVRRYTSADEPYPMPAINVPDYWPRPQQILSGAAGAHRFLWDLHYAPLPGPVSFPIAATYRNTAPAPTAPWVMPGTYTVRLTVNGKVYEQPLTVKMDPRVKTPIEKLQLQHDWSKAMYEGRQQLAGVAEELGVLHSKLDGQLAKAGKKEKALLTTRLERVMALEKELPGLQRSLYSVFEVLQDSDFSPTTQAVKAARETEKLVGEWVKKWEEERGEK